MPKFKDRTGEVHGRLMVLRRAPDGESGGRNLVCWFCRCDCGNEVAVRSDSLTSGCSTSCGHCPNRIDHFGDAIVIWLERRSGHALPCFINAADYDLVKKYRWYVHPSRNSNYAMTAVPGSGNKNLFMHELISGVKKPDHIDHDGLNNRRENLRPASATEQCRHERARSDKVYSQYKCVSWHCGSGRWRAYITVNGKQISLGYFEREIDAARAYNRAAIAYFKEFAVLNDVDDVSDLMHDGIWVNGPLRGQRAEPEVAQKARMMQ